MEDNKLLLYNCSAVRKIPGFLANRWKNQFVLYEFETRTGQ
jgi:hypothetical protein